MISGAADERLRKWLIAIPLALLEFDTRVGTISNKRGHQRADVVAPFPPRSVSLPIRWELLNVDFTARWDRVPTADGWTCTSALKTRSSYSGRPGPSMPTSSRKYYADFFAAFTPAHRTPCAAAICFRAASESAERKFGFSSTIRGELTDFGEAESNGW